MEYIWAVKHQPWGASDELVMVFPGTDEGHEAAVALCAASPLDYEIEQFWFGKRIDWSNYCPYASYHPED